MSVVDMLSEINRHFSLLPVVDMLGEMNRDFSVCRGNGERNLRWPFCLSWNGGRGEAGGGEGAGLEKEVLRSGNLSVFSFRVRRVVSTARSWTERLMGVVNEIDGRERAALVIYQRSCAR